jgi:hypothetical protein
VSEEDAQLEQARREMARATATLNLAAYTYWQARRARLLAAREAQQRPARPRRRSQR